MKSMRDLIRLITETQEPAHVTQDYLRDVYDSAMFIASKERTTNLGAALFYALKGEDKFDYFDSYIIPRLEAADFPPMSTDSMLHFQDDLKAFWKTDKAHQQEVMKRWPYLG